MDSDLGELSRARQEPPCQGGHCFTPVARPALARALLKFTPQTQSGGDALGEEGAFCPA